MKCPKCGNEYVQYKKIPVESNNKSTGFLKKKVNDSNVSYQTVGVCYECGNTWNADTPNIIPNEVSEEMIYESDPYVNETNIDEGKSDKEKHSKKPWWWWVLVILVFPISLSVWFWKTDIFKASKTAKIGIIAGVWIAAFISSMSTGETIETTDTIVSTVENVAEQIETSADSDILANAETNAEAQLIDTTTSTQQETNVASDITTQENTTDTNIETVTEIDSSKTEHTQEPSVSTPDPIDAYATNTVNIREQPNTSCTVLGKVQQGQKVSVIGEEADWSHISYNGIDGYIKSEYLSENKPVAKEPVVNTTPQQSTPNTTTSNVTLQQPSTTTANSNNTNSSTTSNSTASSPSNNGNSGSLSGNYVVNNKNGKIHVNGGCTATNPTSKSYLNEPVCFNTYEEALSYSKSIKNQSDPRCGNCWK